MTATTDLDPPCLDRRPGPGPPRAYDFPTFERPRLPNGLTLILAPPAGPAAARRRSSSSAATPVAARRGEPAAQAGVTVLTARAMSEGTRERDAVAFVEASERLGAELGGGRRLGQLRGPGRGAPLPPARRARAAGRDGPPAELPGARGGAPARGAPQRPAAGDGRRRGAASSGSSRAPSTPMGRPTAASWAAPRRPCRASTATPSWPATPTLLRPEGCTLIVCGDLDGLPVDDDRRRGLRRAWPEAPASRRPARRSARTAARPGRRVVVVDRPGAPQSEIRIGHVGTPRRIADFHALAVMNALLGGLFNSRLNRLLREERGYTYGVHSDFDMRRAAGPVRRALRGRDGRHGARHRGHPGRARAHPRGGGRRRRSWHAARDYLVGVFPLRFETSAQVAGALAGLVVHGLPDDELDRYRPAIAAVTAADVLRGGPRPHRSRAGLDRGRRRRGPLPRRSCEAAGSRRGRGRPR